MCQMSLLNGSTNRIACVHVRGCLTLMFHSRVNDADVEYQRISKTITKTEILHEKLKAIK